MKRKMIRAITGLLCAAMFFSNVAGMNVYAMEDGAGQEMQMQEPADSDAEPEKIEKIGDSAFLGCKAMNHINIQNAPYLHNITHCKV